MNAEHHAPLPIQNPAIASGPSTSPELRVLFVLAPYSDLDQPGIMIGWLSWFARMDQALSSANPRYAGQLLAYDASLIGAGDKFSGRRIALDQNALRLNSAISGIPSQELDRLPETAPLLEQLALHAKTWLNGFVPDVIIHMSDDTWLRRAFPNAATLNVEVGWLFRPPFVPSWQLDPIGRGKGRILRDHASKLIGSISLGPEEHAFLERIKSAAKERLSRSSNAQHFVSSLRDNHKKVLLLPLAERFALDGRTPLFASVEPLLHSIEKSVAVILTQHPLAVALTPSETDYLLGHFKNLYLVPKDPEINTQALIPWVDDVIADFSSVALQALFYDVNFISAIDDLPFADEYFGLRNPAASIIAAVPGPVRDKVLYWLLTSYHLGEQHIFNGAWLSEFLRRAIENRQEPWRIFSGIPVRKHTDSISTWLDIRGHRISKCTPTNKSIDQNTKPQAETQEQHTEVGNNLALTLGAGDTRQAQDQEEYERAANLLSQGKKNEAFEILLQLVQDGTDCWEAYNDLAALAVQQGDIDAAIQLLSAAIEKETTPGKARLNLSSIYTSTGNGEKALETISPLLRHSPQDLDALDLVRQILGNHGQPISVVAWARLITDLRTPQLKAMADTVK